MQHRKKMKFQQMNNTRKGMCFKTFTSNRLETKTKRKMTASRTRQQQNVKSNTGERKLTFILGAAFGRIDDDDGRKSFDGLITFVVQRFSFAAAADTQLIAISSAAAASRFHRNQERRCFWTSRAVCLVQRLVLAIRPSPEEPHLCVFRFFFRFCGSVRNQGSLHRIAQAKAQLQVKLTGTHNGNSAITSETNSVKVADRKQETKRNLPTVK